MRQRWLIYGVVFASLGALLAACISVPPTPPVTPPPTGTPAPPSPPAPSSTPLPTLTPTPTSTPTPTAAPLDVFNGLRAQRDATPQAQRGAPCGLVDLLDFPVGAPSGADYQAPWPFGYYSDRYNGLHAGEDWIAVNRQSLGKPVYSIGPGTVLYAQPLGWGIDLGTIIVRHVLTTGASILSFYGHLEPESVTLRSGECVQRGQIIGRIGNPRGRPHLHFEIRHHLPDRPGPGYWSRDPRLAGWEPPTEYIWDQRLRTSPGVKWTRPFTTANSLLIGALVSNTLAIYDQDRVLGLDDETGRVRWSTPMTSPVQAARVDESGRLIYLTTVSGTLHALDAGGRSVWQAPFVSAPRASLLPLPGGGIVAHDGRNLSGFAPTGERLWQIADIAVPLAGLIMGDQLVFTLNDPAPALYRLDRAGALQKIADVSGQLAASPDYLFVHAPTALYRLGEQPELLKTLDRVLYNDASLIALPHGGLLAAHHSLADLRLIALWPDGSLRWERSLRALSHSAPTLLALGGEVYAVTEEGAVWWIDQQSGEAQQVLTGARLSSLTGRPRAVGAAPDTLIVDWRGGRLVALDPRVALTPADTLATDMGFPLR